MAVPQIYRTIPAESPAFSNNEVVVIGKHLRFEKTWKIFNI